MALAPVDHDLRACNLGSPEQRGVGTLPRGGFRAREGVEPAEAVPVIDVKGQREHVLTFGEVEEERLGRRAGRAAL
jgi:hypothetical protein